MTHHEPNLIYQYHICALTVYSMKFVSLMLNISIDIENGAPDHCTYFWGGINASNKRYLRENWTCDQKILPQLVK